MIIEQLNETMPRNIGYYLHVLVEAPDEATCRRVLGLAPDTPLRRFSIRAFDANQFFRSSQSPLQELPGAGMYTTSLGEAKTIAFRVLMNVVESVREKPSDGIRRMLLVHLQRMREMDEHSPFQKVSTRLAHLNLFITITRLELPQIQHTEPFMSKLEASTVAEELIQKIEEWS